MSAKQVAKDAATKAGKDTWDWIKHYRWPVVFACAGVVGVFSGSLVDEFKRLEIVTPAGFISGAWAVILWVVERASKRTGTEVSHKIDTVAPKLADEVVERIFEKVGGIKYLAREAKREAEEAHQALKVRAEIVDGRLNAHEAKHAEHDRKFNHVSATLAELKPGFGMPR